MTAARVERLTGEDLVTLATDVGPAPLQVGALIRLASPCPDPDELVRELGSRIRSVPRLRQRLARTPPGCGRPVWVDDDAFGIERQVDVVSWRPPSDERALFDLATSTITAPLPRDRPLWRITVVTSQDGAAVALLVAFHHVLTDGIGGLAVLAALVDGWPAPDDDLDFPRPAPTTRELLVEAWRSRAASVLHLPGGVRRLIAAVALLRGGERRRPTRSSLNRPTGPARRMAVVRADVAAVREAAKSHGATLNDVVIAAVSGALSQVLEARGERVDRFVVSIPVASRTGTTVDDLGNRVGAVPVEVPAGGHWDQRVRATATATRRAKEGWRGASNAVIGPVFRALAALHAFRPFVEHQHLVHTFVTNLKGPTEPLTILGARIESIDAVAVVPGNATASFAVLSYAGRLAVTVLVDPDRFPELDTLADLIGDGLAS